MLDDDPLPEPSPVARRPRRPASSLAVLALSAALLMSGVAAGILGAVELAIGAARASQYDRASRGPYYEADMGALLLEGIAYLVFAAILVLAGRGTLHALPWAWVLGVAGSLATLALGALLLSYSPLLGIPGHRNWAEGLAPGVWITAILSGVALACSVAASRVLRVSKPHPGRVR